MSHRTCNDGPSSILWTDRAPPSRDRPKLANSLSSIAQPKMGLKDVLRADVATSNDDCTAPYLADDASANAGLTGRVSLEDMQDMLQHRISALNWDDGLDPVDGPRDSSAAAPPVPRQLHGAASAYGSDLLEAAVAAEAWDWTGMDVATPLGRRCSLQPPVPSSRPGCVTPPETPGATAAPLANLPAECDTGSEGQAIADAVVPSQPFDGVLRLAVADSPPGARATDAGNKQEAPQPQQMQQQQRRWPIEVEPPDLPADFFAEPQLGQSEATQQKHQPRLCVPDPVPQPETWAGNERWLEAILARIPVPGKTAQSVQCRMKLTVLAFARSNSEVLHAVFEHLLWWAVLCVYE